MNTEVAQMIAAFKKDGLLHAARLHFKEATVAWCATEHEGPLYFSPSWAFDGRIACRDVSVCVQCSAALCALAVPE